MSQLKNAVNQSWGCCPRCFNPLNGHSASNGELIEPSVGDISVCAKCGVIMVYSIDWTLRLATREERAQFSVDWPDLFMVATSLETVYLERKLRNAPPRN